MNQIDYDPEKFDVDEYRNLIPEETEEEETTHEHDKDCKYLGFGLWDCGITDQH